MRLFSKALIVNIMKGTYINRFDNITISLNLVRQPIIYCLVLFEVPLDNQYSQDHQNHQDHQDHHCLGHLSVLMGHNCSRHHKAHVPFPKKSGYNLFLDYSMSSAWIRGGPGGLYIVFYDCLFDGTYQILQISPHRERDVIISPSTVGRILVANVPTSKNNLAIATFTNLIIGALRKS